MPSGPKKRRAARNKMNKDKNSNTNADNEMIPKVASVEDESNKDVVSSVEVEKEKHVLNLVECDNVVGTGGGGVGEEDKDDNGVNGSQSAGARMGDEEDTAARDECLLKEDQYEIIVQMMAKVGDESSLEVPHEGDDNAPKQYEIMVKMPEVSYESFLEVPHEGDDNAPKVESVVVPVDGDCVEGDSNIAVKGDHVVSHAEGVPEVVAAEDEGEFGPKKEELGKEMVCAGGFKDEGALEEYFGKVLALVDELKAVLLLHKDLIKKGALVL